MTRRPRTGTCGVGVLAGLLLLASPVRAHRLDEYLQAARLSLTPERVALELDLTPGVAIAPEVIGIIDRNADRTISLQEAREYGLAVLSEIAVALDGRPVGVALDRIEIPPEGDLRAGIGTIELRASGSVERPAPGRHELRFRNDHHPAAALYLINALAPEHPAIKVATQQRDPTQREGRIEYELAGSSRVRWIWLLAAVACFHRHIAAGFTRLRKYREFHSVLDNASEIQRPRVDPRACELRRHRRAEE